MRSFTVQGNAAPVPISKIVMGTTYLGSGIDRDTSFALLDRYYELGGRTIDTARAYGQETPRGRSLSEATVGEWIRSRGVRGNITLITKCCHPPNDYSDSRVGARFIREDIEDSLALIGTDRIDLFFMHRDDERVPVEEIMDTLAELVADGTVGAIGASNWRFERIRAANAYARKNGLPEFAVSQIQWSLAACDVTTWQDPTLVFMDDTAYREYLAAGIPVMAFSAQAKGLFSKYIQHGPEAFTSKTERFHTPDNLKRAENVRRLMEAHGTSAAAIVLAYITCNRLQAAANIGCSNLAQLEDSMRAAELVLTQKEIEELAAV